MGEEHNFCDFKCLVAVKIDHIMNMLCTASCALNKVPTCSTITSESAKMQISVCNRTKLFSQDKIFEPRFILNVLCPKTPVIHEFGIGHHNKKY